MGCENPCDPDKDEDPEAAECGGGEDLIGCDDPDVDDDVEDGKCWLLLVLLDVLSVVDDEEEEDVSGLMGFFGLRLRV